MKALYPLSANPWHAGHQFVYDAACRIFGEENVIVGIAKNSSKSSLAPDVIQWITRPCVKNIVVIDGLVAEYCFNNKIEFLVRGLRNGYDLEAEIQMNAWNNEIGEYQSYVKQDPNYKLQTIFIPSDPALDHVSSSSLRELVKFDKEGKYVVDKYIDATVFARWKRVLEMDNKKPHNGIFFGKSCVGKTTFFNDGFSKHLGLLNVDPSLSFVTNYVNVDLVFWNYYGGSEKQKSYLQKAFRELVYMKKKIKPEDKSLKFYNLVWEVSKDMDWKSMFYVPNERVRLFDFPAFGVYYHLIDKDILSNFSFVKLTASDDTRKKIVKAKTKNTGLDWEYKVSKLDEIYVDVPFCDYEYEIQYDKSIKGRL